jgi:hypothetical protein
MRRKRRIQRAILLREGDYCCDQAQFAAPSPARGDSPQKLVCLWPASNQQHRPDRCKREQSNGEQGEQSRPRFNLFDAGFGEAEIPLGVPESLFAAEPKAIFCGHRFGAQPQIADQTPGLQFAFFVARPIHRDPELAWRFLAIIEPTKAASSRIAFEPDRIEFDPSFAVEDFDRAFDAKDVGDIEFIEQCEQAIVRETTIGREPNAARLGV